MTRKSVDSSFRLIDPGAKAVTVDAAPLLIISIDSIEAPAVRFTPNAEVRSTALVLLASLIEPAEVRIIEDVAEVIESTSKPSVSSLSLIIPFADARTVPAIPEFSSNVSASPIEPVVAVRFTPSMATMSAASVAKASIIDRAAVRFTNPPVEVTKATRRSSESSFNLMDPAAVARSCAVVPVLISRPRATPIPALVAVMVKPNGAVTSTTSVSRASVMPFSATKITLDVSDVMELTSIFPLVSVRLIWVLASAVTVPETPESRSKDPTSPMLPRVAIKFTPVKPATSTALVLLASTMLISAVRRTIDVNDVIELTRISPSNSRNLMPVLAVAVTVEPEPRSISIQPVSPIPPLVAVKVMPSSAIKSALSVPSVSTMEPSTTSTISASFELMLLTSMSPVSSRNQIRLVAVATTVPVLALSISRPPTEPIEPAVEFSTTPVEAIRSARSELFASTMLPIDVSMIWLADDSMRPIRKSSESSRSLMALVAVADT